MTSPSGGFGSLGVARGSIEIGFSQLQQLQAVSRQVGSDISRNLGQIDVAAKKTEQSLGSLARGFLGIQAARQVAQFAIHADELATAYRRQSVAAVSLAGSQEKLNALLESYDKVTGRAIDKANLLAQVTQLQAIGFADTTAEIEAFATAVRGISIATGRPQDYVQQQLQLAIANQSTMRLDQIGLGVDEITNKVDELKRANSSLSDAQAYQNAILGIATQKYGALTRSAAAQATGLEKARKAWADMTLEIGESFGPATSGVMMGLTAQLTGISGLLRGVARDASAAGQALRGMGGNQSQLPGPGDFLSWDPIGAGANWLNNQLGLNRSPVVSNATRPYGRQYSGGMGAPSGPSAEQLADQRAEVLSFQQSLQDIERDAQNARLDETRSYEQQRTETIRQYEVTIAREAEDFARQRARAEAQHAKQIADLAEDTARREAEAQENLAETIADAQQATADRINDIEERYRRNRERAERTHRDNLLDAAARLDATAVFNEQKRFARESEEAKTAHDEQISQEQENLAERIQQAQEAHQEQLQDAREADAERLADMQEAFEEQKRLEDEDRAIKLQRMAEDQAAQLEQQAAAHAERMEQINRHAADERDALEDAHLKALEELGVKLPEAYVKIQRDIETALMKEHDRFMQALAKQYAVQGPMTGAQANANMWQGVQLGDPSSWNFPTTPPSTRSGDTRSFTVAPGAIQVFAAPGQSAQSVAAAVRDEMTRVFRELAN